MKKIGLVGGISWSSTVDYYRLINEEMNRCLGGLNYAECIIYSVNFNDFQQLNEHHDWNGNLELLSAAATNLERAGAGIILLCANTAHIIAEELSQGIGVPLIDIRDATIAAITAKGLRKVGLLGTVYTMELDFYKNRLLKSGIEPIIPSDKGDRDYIEDTLLHELGKGIIKEPTRVAYVRIIDQLIKQGAEGIILGCTEIPLLICQNDVSVPVFNTTQIHAHAAVEAALTLIPTT